MKQNIYTFVSSIITVSMSKCSQNVVKMIDEEVTKQNLSLPPLSISVSLSKCHQNARWNETKDFLLGSLSLSLPQSDLPHSSTTPKNGKKRNKISKPTLKLDKNGTQNAWHYQKLLNISQTQRNFAFFFFFLLPQMMYVQEEEYWIRGGRLRSTIF
jgi:hypothetical protein